MSQDETAFFQAASLLRQEMKLQTACMRQGTQVFLDAKIDLKTFEELLRQIIEAMNKSSMGQQEHLRALASASSQLEELMRQQERILERLLERLQHQASRQAAAQKEQNEGYDQAMRRIESYSARAEKREDGLDRLGGVLISNTSKTWFDTLALRAMFMMMLGVSLAVLGVGL